ncbi:TIGR02587 family membrane protein [Mesorhizobium sp. YIM 152430]|uniref:TIGR02587 family membrane protein n=1 Tax=Mesorhizobium sp. YIM 152430 TaxID=3031761 RepID=UPI0023DAC7DB|nr:TIGR02587 family membrane protein [Mesorhizobium sp. YIM 152430]MDF1600655.1 TIGR02587 family membrane protein [Mesorhizobium sp. YIM 152430]
MTGHGRFAPQTPALLRDAGRAIGGALVFSLPMLMTMEMWQLAYTVQAWRIAVLVAVAVPLLVGLSHVIGIGRRRKLAETAMDAFFAFGIAAFTSAVVLTALGVLAPGMSVDEIIGKIAIQSVPAAIGALLARSQLRSGADETLGDREETYAGELFLMMVGALFLGFNLAPTEEMILISYLMTEWHGIALMAISIAAMHGFVFAVEFKGGSELSQDTPWWSALLRFTLPGYAIAALISLFLLWVFGRTEGLAIEMVAMAVVVLAFPSAIGAAAARLIL